MTDLFPGRTAYRQLLEWGYPQGYLRPVPPADRAFSVIHITGNSRLPTAAGEIGWRANDPANQNSATFFVNRDGTVWQALGDPLRMDPWSNGDLRSPDLSNPRIAAVVRDGVNANERTLVAIENVGYEPGYSITAAQIAANAKILAYYHAKAGVPVNRQTVIGHYQINGVNRPNCPAVNKGVIDQIVAAANPTIPDTATAPQEGDMKTTITISPLPAGSRVRFAAGTTTPIYDADVLGKPVRSIVAPATRGTWADVDATVTIERDPLAAPNGTFRRISLTSPYNAGLLVHKDTADLHVPEPEAPVDVEARVNQAISDFNNNLNEWAASRPKR